jgi:hypothetical protein
MSDRIKIGGVCERDLDLFLQEQLISSPNFCRWFTGKLDLDGMADIAESVQRGQTDQTGESDITAKFRLTNDSSVTVYVENKIKAAFQQEQYGRYLRRAEKAVQMGETDDYRIVLFAPQKYLDKNDLEGFEAAECYKISYDEVLGYFDESGADSLLSLPLRDRYKSALLGEAIRISGGTYKADTEDFWHRYWEEVNLIAPEFNFPYPEGRKAAGGDTIEFTRSDLKARNWPINPEPCHRLVQGNFGEFGKAPYGAFYIKVPKYFENQKFNALVNRLEPHLTPHMMIVKSKPSAAIRIAVPQIRKSNWTKDQIPALRSALYLGKDLYQWFLSDRVQMAWSGLI